MLRRIEPREVDTDPLQPSHPGLSSNVRQSYQLVEGLGVPADQGAGQGVEGDQGVVRVAPEGEANAKYSKLSMFNCGEQQIRKKEFLYIHFLYEGREARGDQEVEESGRKAGIVPRQLSHPGGLEIE